jgi:signal transduction histidine kinase
MNSGRYTYALARRLHDAQNLFSGIAFAAIEPAYMQDFCWANRLSDNFEAVLTNQAGLIIASCRPADLSAHSPLLGHPAGKVLFAGQAAGQIPESGLAHAKGLMISTSPVPGFADLRLVAILPREVALANWHSRLLEIGSLGILLSLLLIFGTVLVRRQVVQLRTMTEALSESRDLLESRVQEATAALAREKDTAERANAAKSRFLAAASHDLRQPLHALSLFTTDLLRQAATGRLREVPRIAEQISASTQTLGEMLNALLDISRLDIDGVRPDIQEFPLSHVFARLHDAFHRQADAHQLRLRFHPTRSQLHTDPRLLEQLIGNLISNAIRYTPAGGSILVGVRTQGEKLRIEIRDSGIGIAKEHQTAIFTEFFQVANNAREQDGGLGLGLSIVERLARGLDIQILLDSQIGHGTTFGLLIAKGRGTVLASTKPSASSGRVHFIGDSATLATCRTLIETWNYETSSSAGDIAEDLPGETVIICDAEMIPSMSKQRPLIVIGETAPADLPPGAHVLPPPVRPARLRALLRSIMLRR